MPVRFDKDAEVGNRVASRSRREVESRRLTRSLMRKAHGWMVQQHQLERTRGAQAATASVDPKRMAVRF